MHTGNPSVSARESGKHGGNRREQDRKGSHCHGTNSLGGIRHTKPPRKYQNDWSYDNKPGYDEKQPRSDFGLDGEVRPWEVKLKPRTKSQKTSEDQREEQCKGPDRERSLYWSSLEKGSVWLEHDEKSGQQYGMRSNSQGSAHAGFCKSEQRIANFFQMRWKTTRGF